MIIWIDQIIRENNLGQDSCVIILNPPGVENNDGSGNILGYHADVNGVPYCFCNVRGSNLTVDDKRDRYAETITHEIAEMAIDPKSNSHNPEVCDACAGNCFNNWRAYFDNNNKFLGANQGDPNNNPVGNYAYFTAIVVSKNFPLHMIEVRPGDFEPCVDSRFNIIACDYDPAGPSPSP